MPSLLSRIKDIWSSVKEAPAITRANFAISPSHTDEGPGLAFQPRGHYLQIMLNEMFLKSSRKWFAGYSPMTFVAASYIYGREKQIVPMVVGPSMLAGTGKVLPGEGMIFRNTPVTTLHPYQGGALTLTVILYRVQNQNHADKVLQVLESLAGVVSPIAPAIPFASYLSMAGNVMDGVEQVLGLAETDPVVGSHVTISPDVGQPFLPGYSVLIDVDENAIDQGRFWVKDGRLLHGASLDTAEYYRDHDFVLYQVDQGVTRSDERLLPFYTLWEKTLELGQQSSNEHFWKEAKAHFNTLKREMRASPDLTKPDYDKFRQRFLDELKEARQEAVDDGKLAAGGLDDEEAAMESIAAELDALD